MHDVYAHLYVLSSTTETLQVLLMFYEQLTNAHPNPCTHTVNLLGDAMVLVDYYTKVLMSHSSKANKEKRPASTAQHVSNTTQVQLQGGQSHSKYIHWPSNDTYCLTNEFVSLLAAFTLQSNTLTLLFQCATVYYTVTSSLISHTNNNVGLCINCHGHMFTVYTAFFVYTLLQVDNLKVSDIYN